MYEDVAVAAGAGLGFVEQARAGGAEARNGRGEIRDAQRDMVQAFAAPGQKTADDGIGIGGFEQLDARSAHGQHGNVYLFVRDGFARGYLYTELALVEAERGFDGFDGDAEMIDGKVGEPTFRCAAFAREFTNGL